MEKRIIRLGANDKCTPHGSSYEDYCDVTDEEVQPKEKEEQPEKE